MKSSSSPTSESQNFPPNKDNKKGVQRDSSQREFWAILGAIIFTVVGIGLVVILHEVYGIDDSVTIITLLIVPVLVYGILSGRISEFKLPGGVEAKIRQDIEMLKGEMRETENIVSHVFTEASVVAIPSEIEPQMIRDPEQEMEKLIDQYKVTREELEYGWERTMKMTGIVRKMINLAPHLAQFAVNSYLDSEDQGQRLAAYAYFYAKPHYEEERFRKLVDSVSMTILRYRAFEQYWGLQAISRNLPKEGEALPLKVKTDLQSFAQRLPQKTDRDYLLRTILSKIEN